MSPVLTVLLLLGGIALIIGFLAAGAHVLDQREAGAKVRRKRVRELETALHQVEQVALNTLQVNPGDLTAHQVLNEVGKARGLR